MNCRRIEELIPLYVGGDLDAKHEGDVQAHVDECSRCRGAVEEYSESQGWLRSYAAPELSEQFFDNLKAIVLKDISDRKSAPSIIERLIWYLTGRRLAAASAALLLLFAAVFFSLVNHRGERHGDHRIEAADNPVPAAPPEAMRPESNPTSGSDKESPRRAHNGARQRRAPLRNRIEPRQSIARQVEVEFPATEASAPEGADLSDGMLRMEIQTSDPNIRIIWFSPKSSNTD